MLKTPTLTSILLTGALITACGGSDNDKTSSTGITPIDETRVVFSPGSSQLPFPNDLLFERGEGADGTKNVSQCVETSKKYEECLAEEAANPVISGIDLLDGASVMSPIDIEFDGPLDPNQTLNAASFISFEGSVIPNPGQNVFLLPLSYPSGDGLLQASGEVPTFAEAIAYQTAATTGDVSTLVSLAAPTARAELITLDGKTNRILRINPLKPLQPKTKYLVVVTNMTDASGNPVFQSGAYEFIKKPESDLSTFGGTTATLEGVRAAIQGWEQLAAGYFGFMQSIFDLASVGFQAPTADDIILTFTFTTTSTTDVLKAAAAPETFFESSLSSGYKKDAIAKLTGGEFTLSGVNTSLSATDQSINGTLITLLTTATIADQPNPLYNANIAGAIGAGADYATIAADASAAYLMQRAAAEAAISVYNSATPDIATTAAGTVSAIAGGAGVSVTQLFTAPAARTTNFFRVDAASDLFAPLAAPANIYQGEITLPQLQSVPNAGEDIISGKWTANTTIGGIIDISSGNDPGTTPPSDVVTYRYPFATIQDNVTIPISITVPDEAALSAFGITRPANGWPVIIYTHGITSDRTSSFVMANAMAFACVDSVNMEPSGTQCFATIAIDHPLHGVAPEGSNVPGLFSATDPDNPITPNIGDNTPSAELTERHYDYTADETNSPVAMDYTTDFGESGSLFVNLNNFANVRDNLRQLVIDLLNVNASIDSMDLNDDGTANELDPNNVFFAGQSLGGINGLPFVAINNDPAVQNSPFSTLPRIKAAAAFNTSGSAPRILTNSPDLGPNVLQGLAAGSGGLIVQGTSTMETYLNVFQGLLDSVDPTAFAPSLLDTQLYLTEIVGDGTSENLPDQTIPNASDSFWGEQYGPLSMVVAETGFVIDGLPAPLVGTEPLAAQVNAVDSQDVEDGNTPSAIIVRFTEGNHVTPASADNMTVFQQIISDMATLFSAEID